jgi:hypothetical protein
VTTPDHRLDIAVLADDPGQSGVQADELREYILDAAADVRVDSVRAEPTAQDFGATLVVLLAAPSIVALVKGVQRWMERRNTSKVTFKNGRKSLVVEGISATSAAELGENLRALLADEDAE